MQGALVRGGSSTSNILELHPHRDSKVLLHEFGVVRLDRTFSDYISLSLSLSLSEDNTLCYLCNDVVREGSTRFDVLEPPRTSA